MPTPTRELTARTAESQLYLLAYGYEPERSYLDEKGDLVVRFEPDESLAADGVPGVFAMLKRLPLRTPDRERAQAIITDLRNSVEAEALNQRVTDALAISDPAVSSARQLGNGSYFQRLTAATRAKSVETITQIGIEALEWCSAFNERRTRFSASLAALQAARGEQ